MLNTVFIFIDATMKLNTQQTSKSPLKQNLIFATHGFPVYQRPNLLNGKFGAEQKWYHQSICFLTRNKLF